MTRARSSFVAVAVLAFLVALAAGAGPAGASTRKVASQQLTVYSVAAVEQFLNHADDRQRGYGNNPFGNFQAPTATTKESNGGPFPGDQALFQFTLYTAPDRKTTVGSAVFLCNYNFKHHGFCDGIYRLDAGSLLVKGALNFDAKTFSLVVTGGTGKYRSLTGNLTSTPSAKLSQRVAFVLDPIPAQQARTLTFASVPTSEQFLNHADDRQRGYGNNPFGGFLQAKATTSEKNNGPFPGDQALFEFNIYSGKDLNRLAGSAVFTCNYGFNRIGFCDALYQLSGGTLVAEGALDFNAKTFSLVVTGGTGKYQLAAGQVAASPSTKGSQRIAIGLV